MFNAGVEASFKLTREWDKTQSRSWGLDGLRHVIQPFMNFSFVRTSTPATDILQFDRLNASTELPSLDFPQFTTLDTITNWSICRLGVRNRWETRRDEGTLEWLTTESYVDYNMEKPNFPGFATEQTFSNVVNRVTFTPLPWISLRLDSQLPLLDDGFTQVNSSAVFRVSHDFTLTLVHRYLYGNKYFSPGSYVVAMAYYRINDNWGVGIRDDYEFVDKPSLNVVPGVVWQQYQIYRDLSSWVASLGLTLRRNVNTTTNTDITNVSVTLTFTLKDLPSFGLPVSFDPTSVFSGN